jgi:hypothetical protein
MPTLCYRNEDRVINGSFTKDEQLIDRINNAAGLILGVSENRTWIEIFFEGDLMHTKTVNLPADTLFDIYVEEIPHKTTVYEHPRTMIFFEGSCDLKITRDQNRIIVQGTTGRGATNVA